MPPAYDRFALIGVPIMAGLLTATVLLTSANERPAVAARVFGYLAAGAEQGAFRVHTTQHLRGVFTDRAVPLTVRVSRGGEFLGEAEAGSAAIADVVVPFQQPADGELDVFVHTAGHELARASLSLRAPLETANAPVAKRQHGSSTIEVDLARGQAVAELPEELRVRVNLAEGETPSLVATATGADVSEPPAPEVACADARCTYRWRIGLTARAPTADLDVVVRRQQTELVRWSGPVHVVPAALWLDPTATDELELRSAVPREEAYVSLLTTTGRFWGTHVSLTVDDGGRARGSVPLPSLPDGPITVLLSTEPNEPPDGAIAWSLRGPRLEGGHLQLLGDGIPAAIAAENDRQNAARRPAYGLIIAAGLFELCYLWWRARRAKRRLATHLAAHGTDAAPIAQSLPLLALVVLSGGIALAFAVLATLSALG